jgi:AcrR family transcriptional regulator
MAPARARQPRLSIEVRREQVLDAALELIVEDGYAATTMEAIARRVDIAKPVVYNAYPDRGALLTSLLERQESRAMKMLAEAMPPRSTDADPTEAMLAWAHRLATAVREDPATWRLMLLPADGTPPVVREHVDEGRAFVLAQARALLAEIFAGRDLDLDLAASGVVATAEQLGRLLIADPEAYTPDRVMAFVRQALRLLTA